MLAGETLVVGCESGDYKFYFSHSSNISILFFQSTEGSNSQNCHVRKHFLVGGTSLKKKVNWVSWSSMCKSKNLWILRINDCGKFNLALFCKWKWRVLT